MRKIFFSVLVFICLSIDIQIIHAAAMPIHRRDGFLLIWQSIGRAVEKTDEKPFADIAKGSAGEAQITFAKARGILDDEDQNFRPNSPLSLHDAQLWLLRTRSIENPNAHANTRATVVLDEKHVPMLAEKYGLPAPSAEAITQDQLLNFMQKLDTFLANEEHEASLYSEKFQGKGTAFGEAFDMHQLTAAHRSYPYNTLVRVTNVDNGKSVIVRINDRGPFVEGRDMDLSLAAFTTIAERFKGKIQARFERMGDINIAGTCGENRYQTRIGKLLKLKPGIPHFLALGKTLSVSSDQSFVIREIIYPDGNTEGTQNWFIAAPRTRSSTLETGSGTLKNASGSMVWPDVSKGETWSFTPSILGAYTFMIGSKEGRVRQMRMEVVSCEENQ